jgi:hypothetical protein
MPLTFLEGTYLTIPTPINLRGFRPRGSGVFLYRMPAYLAFPTDCIRYLLGK